MIRTALLIGAPLAGQSRKLRGVENDIEAVAKLLSAYGFDCERCTGDGATRARILDCMERLIAGSRAGDAVVVYFSGHGGMVINTEHVPDLKTPSHEPPYHQFLVPEDFCDSGDGDFRGILDIELAHLIARLTKRTQNVTVILDCCHGGGMMREHHDMRYAHRGVVRALDPKSFRARERIYNRWIAQRLQELGEQRARAGSAWPELHPDANPHVVRLEAARSDQSAYENLVGDRWHGLLTAAWVKAVEQLRGQRVTWHAIHARVCALVSEYGRGFAHQPHIAGPQHRLLFQLEESALPGAVGVRRSGESLYLCGGTLIGIQAGDRFRVVTPGTDGVDGELGHAAVMEVGPDTARVELVYTEGGQASLDGALAVPVRRGGPGRGVDVRACGAVRASLLRLVEATGTLVPYLGDGDFLARVQEIPASGGTALVEIHDARGCNVTAPIQPGEAVIPVLQRLQRAAIVRGLESGLGEHALNIPFEIRWWRASDPAPTSIRHLGAGVIEGLADVPAAIGEGDEIHYAIFNVAQHKSMVLYVTILDVDVDGRISLRTNGEPSGPAVHINESHDPGIRPHGGRTPLRISWPAEMPRKGPGLRSLVLVVADRPHDLRALETSDLDAYAAEHGLALPALTMATRASARRSSAPGMDVSRICYAVARLDLQVTPST